MSDKHYIGLDTVSFEDNGKQKPVSRVTLFVDDETYYTAGDDTGRELTAECPSATQEMVDALLASLRGAEHQTFSAKGAGLDPAAELGDGVTIGGIYTTLIEINDKGGYPDIAAPGEAESEDEYPYESPMQKEFNRKIAQTRSYIKQSNEEIKLLIENEINGLSSSFTVELNSIRGDITGLQGAFSSMELDLDGLTTRVGDAEGNIAELELTTQEFGVSIKGLEDDFVDLRLDLDGLTVTDSSGTTKIKGSSIETSTLKVAEANISGTLSAKVIDATNLKVAAANITGTLTADQIDATNLKVAAANVTGTITATAISVKDASGNNLLNAGGNAVKIATWNVDNNSLFSGETFDTSDVYLCTGSVGYTSIGGSPALQNWVFKAGANFGVQKDGTAYMSNAILQGTVTANYGKIGPWTVGDVTLYNTVGSVMYSGKALYATDTTVNYTVYLTPRYLYLLYGDARTPMAARWSKIITMAGDEA